MPNHFPPGPRPAYAGRMTARLYLRPTGFVDAPFGHGGKVARLAGGLQFFSQVEMIGPEATELVPVAGIEARLDEAGAAVWARLISARPPLALGERTIRLDQPQIVGIVNVTPDSFSDGGRHADEEAAVMAGHEMASAGAAVVEAAASHRQGREAGLEATSGACAGGRRLAAAGHRFRRHAQGPVMEQALAAGAIWQTTFGPDRIRARSGRRQSGCPSC